MSFAHLHVHTDLSPDGLGRTSDLVEAAHSRGFNSLAVTDHGTLANTVSFYKKCVETGIKPIIGCEGYVEVDGTRNHITLLADGDEGFRSLVNLQNTAHSKTDKSERRATFNIDDLVANERGLVVLTGCVASPLHRMDLPEAVALGSILKRHFKERLFAEIMHVAGSVDIWDRTLRLADLLKLEIVATNDVHYVHKGDGNLHNILTQIKSSYDYASAELYLKTEEEMTNRAANLGIPNFDKYTQNAYNLSEKLRSPTIKHPQVLPKIDDAFVKLTMLAHDGLIKKGLSLTQDYVNRLNYELEIVGKTNFAEYFLILYEVFNFARLNKGIKAGSGRGSGAGSLMNFCLGITEVDPIRYGLSFERFLNPLRKGLPDVDSDFDPEGRDIIMQFMEEKYNAKYVAAYQHLTVKTLVHRLAKVFGYDKNIEQEAADDCTGEAYLNIQDSYPEFARMIELCDGQVFGSSQHAAGMVIIPDDLPIPVEIMKNGKRAAAYAESGNGVEDLKFAGGTKFDFLSVEALSMIKGLETHYSEQAPIPELTSEDDKKLMLETIKSGKMNGLFQFTTASGVQLLNALLVDATIDNLFERMVVATTANRPAVPRELREKLPKLLKVPRSIHPLIDPILAETGGVMLYQEQMMEVFAKIVGGGLAAGDLARRILLKTKHSTEIDVLRKEFFGSSAGIDEETMKLIWEEIVASAGYGFNRSHSVAYMFTAWKQLWFAVKHPIGFFAELMNMDANDDEKLGYHMFNCAVLGIEIVPPDINKSGLTYEYDDDRIYLPLTAVDGLKSGAEVIIRERASGAFTSFDDLRDRLPKKQVNSRAMGNLLAIGALDKLSGDYSYLGVKDELVLLYKTGTRQEKNSRILGYNIPTKALLDYIEKHKLGWKGGLVRSVEERDKGNGRGKYQVIRFFPNDIVVARPMHPNIKAGEIWFYQKKGKWGLEIKARTVKFNE